MQLDTTRLSRVERARCLATGLYLYCGVPGHFLKMCPSRPPRPAVSTLQFEPDIATLPLSTVQLLNPSCSILVSAPVDFGSSGNLISQVLLRQLELPRKRQGLDLKIETIQGKPLGRGYVKFRSPPITSGLSTSRNHLLSGTGGIHLGYQPGMPLVITTLT